MALGIAILGSAFAAGRPKPDLVVAGIGNRPGQVESGDSFNVPTRVKNSGRGRAAASQLKAVLSLNGKVEARDPVIGQRRVPALAAGKRSIKSQAMKVPRATPSGNYLMIVCVDVLRKVKETSERNNCRTTKGRVKVTFVPVIDTTPPTAPTLSGTVPASPADDLTPNLTGSAEAGSAVDVFSGAGCTGAVRGSGSAATFAAGGITVGAGVASDATTQLSARATDAAGNPSACSTPLAYTHDDTPPGPPNLLGTTPSSPGNDQTPILHLTAQPGSQVEIFTVADCSGSPVGTATAGPATTNVPITSGIAANASNDLYARATDAAGNPSTCAGPLTYVHDNIAPGPATITSTAPASPSNDSTPNVLGTADPNATVQVFAGTCTGSPLATVVADMLGNWVATDVPVPLNQATTLRAQSVDAAQNPSACSSFSYTHDSIAPPQPTVTSSSPVSPGTDNTPTLLGSAGGDAAAVELFQSGFCGGSPVGSSSAASYNTSGLTSSVAQRNGQSQPYTVKAFDAAGNNSCSVQFDYTEGRDTTATAETEPNDDPFTVGGRDPYILTEDDLVSGAYGPNGDAFNLTPPATALIHVEGFDASGSDCLGYGVNEDPALTFYLPNLTTVDYDDNGIAGCFSMTRVVNPALGQHAIAIGTLGGDVLDYRFEMRTLFNAGAESEPNDTAVTADAYGAGNDIYLTGTSGGNNVDYFEFRPTAASDARIELADVPGAASVCTSGVAMTVELRDPVTDAVLATGSVAENGASCRFIDGAGTGPSHAGAANLTAGATYRIRVVSSGAAQQYSIALMLR